MNFNLEELVDKVYIKLLNFLSYRNRSERELNAKIVAYLSKEKTTEENVETVKEKLLTRLKADGFYNDKKFAEEVIDSQNLSSHPRNRKQIQNFLYQKGIPKETIEDALESLNVEKEYDNAKTDFEKKLKQLESKPLSNSMRVAKVKSYLFSKGYPTEVIGKVMDDFADR